VKSTKEIKMSNVALFNPSNVPAFARKTEMSDIAKALAGGGGASGKRISIKGMVFRLIADGKEVAAIDERFLDVVIVKAAPKIARVFYAGKWDPAAAATAPDCQSNDGDKPDPKSKNVQSDSCATCAQNVAGSGNGSSRACRYQQRLAVVLANDIEGSVMQLSLPATSIFGKEDGDKRALQAYARWLVAQGVDPSTVVTRMNFDKAAESPKLFFKAMRWLTDDEFSEATAQGATPDATNAITMDAGGMDMGKPPADALKGKAPAKAKAKAPVVEDADEDEDEDEPAAPAPKVRAKTKPAPVAEDAEEEEDEDEAEEALVVKKAAAAKPTSVPGKKALADVVADWDDE
tara:strand:+ start:244 stop:1284 length:1041 start_codon:yes stop_codon:yes gene_type:complete